MDSKLKKRIVKFLRSHDQNTYRQRDLAKGLRIQSYELPSFKKALIELLQEKEIVLAKGNKYKNIQTIKDVVGRLALTQKRFGFVITDDEASDVFIGRRQLNNAIHGDRVKVKVKDGSTLDRRRGHIVDVVERKTSRFLGTVEQIGNNYMLNVSPVSPERGIRILDWKKHEITKGLMIEAKVKDWGSPVSPILVTVVAVLGKAEDPANDFEFIIRKHGYTTTYPTAAEEVASQFSEKSIADEIPNRRDLRNLVSMTIDPVEARDFDDAISVEKRNDGWRLGVHIADVSHYVRQGSELDREAYSRATSVYFTEGVIHMLPESLSANLCSLLPDKDRLAFSALIQLDKNGEVQDVEVVPSVIQSKQRFSYEDVEDIINKNVPHLLKAEVLELKKVCDLLMHQRAKLGSIDFDIPEPLFDLNPEGIPHEITPKERLISHRMVEECMLLANKLAAERYGSEDPFVFRVHDKPPADDVSRFANLLKRLHIPVTLPTTQITPGDIRQVLMDIEDSPFKGLIESVALRTMTKAQYTTKNIGHFGLAFTAYTHFTSPIRRYPDLIIHRRLKGILSGANLNRTEMREVYQAACNQSNRVELDALTAEREYIKLKQLRWLNTQIGNSFQGIISGVMGFGIFVELEKSMAEGLIHIDTLEENDFVFVEEDYMLKSRNTGKMYQLGDSINIRVTDVAFDRQRANFVLAEEN